jgi:hypothetical protein
VGGLDVSERIADEGGGVGVQAADGFVDQVRFGLSRAGSWLVRATTRPIPSRRPVVYEWRKTTASLPIRSHMG